LRVLGHIGSHWATSLTWDLAVGLALFSPTLLQPFAQVKLFKAASRLCLGASVVWLWQAALLKLPWTPGGWLLRAVFVLVFAAVYMLTQRYRQRFTPSPCDTCTRGRFPFCAGNRERVESLLPALRARARHEDAGFLSFVEAWVADGAVLECRLDRRGGPRSPE
jgi:hypothetical protein